MPPKPSSATHPPRSLWSLTTAPAFAAKPFRPPSPATSAVRHVRTRIKSPQTNGVVERFFGTLKYEHLYRGYIGDGDALDMEVHRFRIIYNTVRPHQALNDRTPRQAYLDHKATTENLPIS
jgi:putative transposase